MKRLVTIVLALVFVAMAAGSTTFFLQTKAEYDQRLETERLTAERLRIAETRLREQEEMLQRLRTDPTYVELIIRRRLGYAKPNELVFRFEN
ncbi:FtsB family cell division protein [Synoicihabitans lomoniglobus]|uniref:Septum formation initiator family protein n=1 Tax=Synoicihabitans lomoniglobus TaxID=2909285 RepID=A0AAF0CQT5_9BACT|nr:septum formation initiator family protein [Opitutaceae bacterium LMO-M01]WED66371.1 septum formation initiator family protein [Opitutaceae bacterium LMO-M01]